MSEELKPKCYDCGSDPESLCLACRVEQPCVITARTPDTSAKVDVEAHGWPKTPKDGNALITKPAIDWWWLEHKLATKRSVIRRLEAQVKALQATRSDTSAVELVRDICELIVLARNTGAESYLATAVTKAEQWLKKLGVSS